MSDKYLVTKGKLEIYANYYGGEMHILFNEARLAIMDLQEEVELQRKAACLAVGTLKLIKGYRRETNESIDDAYCGVKNMADETSKTIELIGWRRQ